MPGRSGAGQSLGKSVPGEMRPYFMQAGFCPMLRWYEMHSQQTPLREHGSYVQGQFFLFSSWFGQSFIAKLLHYNSYPIRSFGCGFYQNNLLTARSL